MPKKMRTTPQLKVLLMSSITAPPDCNVVELRQYTLHPGQRDVLIELFDREFVETQEAVGITVIGQFRDLDDPDRFVWLRGFADMDSRRRSLAAFYDGPVWKAHREAANTTMIDSDNVLLLRPAWPGAGIVIRRRGHGCGHGNQRAAVSRAGQSAGVVEVHLFQLHAPADSQTLSRSYRDAGASVLGWYVTELAPNNFSRLPVREGEHLLVGLMTFGDLAAQAALTAVDHLQRGAPLPFASGLARPRHRLSLAPTARSRLLVGDINHG